MHDVCLSRCLPRYEPEVRAWLAGRLPVETVKENPARLVQRGAGLYFKKFLERGLAGRLRRALHDRGALEFRVLERLAQADLGAPRPVAYGADGASTFLVTEEIPNARVLKAEIAGRSLDRWERRGLLGRFARYVRAVHDAGIRHDDFHIGNVLVTPGPTFHVLDVHRARLGRLSQADRGRSLAFVLHSLITFITRSEGLRFMADYLGQRPTRRFVQAVNKAFDRERWRYWESREERCLADSGEFAVEGRWYLRRPMTAEQARGLLRSPDARPVKELPRRSLRVAGDKFIKLDPHAKRIWRHARALEVRHLPTPRLWACGEGAVIGDWLDDGRPLWDFAKLRWPGWTRAERSESIFRLARLVRQMHARGVYHHDLKANNILARGSGVFDVIDLDRVTLGPVSERRRRYNLAQLNAALAAPVTRTDRLRFYRWYAPYDRDWKAGVRAIMALTRARKHAWP